MKFTCENLEQRICLAADIAFAEALTAPAKQRISNVEVADMNRDGVEDVILFSENGEPGILLGRGDGTFQERIQSAGLHSYHVATVGDFNGDGWVDIAAVDEEGYLPIALNRGHAEDGTWAGLAIPLMYGVNYKGQSLVGITAADFDGDGFLDVAATSGEDNSLHVWLNRGIANGQWARFPVLATEYSFEQFNVPTDVTSADLNNDGCVDLVIANVETGEISVLLGYGDGEFMEPTNYDFGASELAGFSTGDVDGNGNLDIVAMIDAAGLSGGSTEIAILRGTGDGSFHDVETVAAPQPMDALSTIDLDNDRDLDLVITGGKLLYLLTNTGADTFELTGETMLSHANGASAHGDFNNDGLVDLIHAGASQNGVSVFLNETEIGSFPGDANQDGAFNRLDIVQVLQAGKYLTGQPATFEQGDWDGDGVFAASDIVLALQTGRYTRSD